MRRGREGTGAGETDARTARLTRGTRKNGPMRTVNAVAHRGDPYRARENTLPALRSALVQGADAVEIAGQLEGDVRARSVTLRESARVKGRVEAQALVVREGAFLTGPVASGEAPAKHAPAAPAAASVAPIPKPPENPGA